MIDDFPAEFGPNTRVIGFSWISWGTGPKDLKFPVRYELSFMAWVGVTSWLSGPLSFAPLS